MPKGYRDSKFESLIGISSAVLLLLIGTVVFLVSKGEVPTSIVLSFAFSKAWYILLVIAAAIAPIGYGYLAYGESEFLIAYRGGKWYLFILAVVFWFFSLGYPASYKSYGVSDPNKKAQLNEYLISVGKPQIK